MIAPIRTYKRTLTGRVRGRRTWLNKLLMQVEVRCDEIRFCWSRDTKHPNISATHYEWRDASVDDLLGKIYTHSLKDKR